MEYNKKIAQMVNGDAVEGFYILKSAAVKTGGNGRAFLSATLADRSGEIEAKMWDYAGPATAEDEGTVIKIRGSVSEYRGTAQLVIERLRLVTENDPVDVGALVPVAPIEVDRVYQEIMETVDSMEDVDYQAVCREMLKKQGNALRVIPAAKSVHHGFLHGLLMHTSAMLRLADFLAHQYSDTVDRDLLLAGTLLHDFAKAEEFTFSQLGLVTEYSVKGQLLGHLVMGARSVERTARELDIPEEKSVLLQHLILSHHGEPDFGAAVRPCCAESELLCLIDQIDSKMEIYRENLAEVPVGKFSSRIFALEKKIYHHP